MGLARLSRRGWSAARRGLGPGHPLGLLRWSC